MQRSIGKNFSQFILIMQPYLEFNDGLNHHVIFSVVINSGSLIISHKLIAPYMYMFGLILLRSTITKQLADGNVVIWEL